MIIKKIVVPLNILQHQLLKYCFHGELVGNACLLCRINVKLNSHRSGEQALDNYNFIVGSSFCNNKKCYCLSNKISNLHVIRKGFF